MIAIDIAKRVRASRLGNLVVRRALRFLVSHLDRLAAGWRICGTPRVTLQGASFRPMPELRDRIPADNGEQVAALMTSHGYAFFAVGERGILRVSSLREIADGGSNYLFVKHPPDSRFIPYSDAQAIRTLATR